jgi:putative restriction endonuclease
MAKKNDKIMKNISNYIMAFKKLRRAHQHGGAPHKPVLLLSILEGVSRGEISSNKIFITPELILCFKEIWSKFVHTPHQLNFALPFYHMRTEFFWKLKCKNGYEIGLTSSHSVKSLVSLYESLQYAEINEDLFLLMKDSVINGALKNTIIGQYFPNQRDVKIDCSLIKKLENQILNDNQLKYKSRIEKLENSLNKIEIEEDLFVRGSLFKREVPKIYNYTCAISRMRIVSTSNTQMVDACHIVPFSISKDDTIGNGISLSPNFHRAFDRGLISISEDYKVIVSECLIENQSPFSISNFKGIKLLLPENKGYYPRVESLEWHRNNRLLR